MNAENSRKKSIKLFSWNVNGLRAVLRKKALQDFLEKKKPDILCLQEIKCKEVQVDFDFSSLGYELFLNPAKRPGYSGTAFLIKKEIVEDDNYKTISALETLLPEKIKDLSLEEGRIEVLEGKKFFLVNVYTPNSKPDLSRLELREKTWDPGFLKLLTELEKKKPVISCGDFNAAHEEIDIARPKTNHHSAGFTDEERKGITNIIENGFIDTFRTEHPKEIKYTWWSHWGKARENNVGWRIDYFFTSKDLERKIKSAEIHETFLGSDHCPVSLELEL